MRVRKMVVGAAAGAAVIVLGQAPAGATHVHSLQTGNGKCVLLARNGGEKNVELPFATAYDEGKRHPLHVLVHMGRPGERRNIGVYGTPRDPCSTSGSYLNNR